MTSLATELRSCKKCGINKPLDATHFGHLPNGNHRHACRSCMRAASRAHAKANPEGVRRRSREYQQRKKGWNPSQELIFKLFQEQAGFCPCCGEALGSDNHVDHLQPTSQGGGNEEDNLILVHRTCNQDKHAKNFAQYLTWRLKCGMKVVSPPTEACAAKIAAHLLVCF